MSNVIVSAGVGSWYPLGIDRLELSLQEHGWGGSTMFWRDEYPEGSPTHQEQPYAFKIRAIEAAHRAGHRFILWCDSSVWAVKNPEPIFSLIQNQGYYLWDSGHWCDTWINDKTLAAFGVTRGQAHDIRMISANVMGFDMENPTAQKFMERWNWALDHGLFPGSWKREPEDNEDAPYLGHRHDQSSASLIANELRMRIERIGVNCQYRQKDPAKASATACLLLEGM